MDNVLNDADRLVANRARVAPSAEEREYGQFRRVALFSGRPMYWHVYPDDPVKHADAVRNLLNWGLDHPGTSLGIDTEGLKHVLDDPPEAGWHDGAMAEERFKAAARDLLGTAAGPGGSGEYVWMPGSEGRWWVDATAEYLEFYAPWVREHAQNESVLLPLFGRHGCVLFGRFERNYFENNLDRWLRPEHCGHALEILNSPELCDVALYWSWRLTDFATDGSNLIHVPMLSLWSAWPAGGSWAPERPQSASTATLSADEAADVLEKAMWQKVETIFAYIRQSFGLFDARLPVGGCEAQPPVFYFLENTKPPTDPLDCATKMQRPLHRLVKTCLGSDDPQSQEVAWGVFEGDFLTLRREFITEGRYLPLYLLLLLDRKPLNEQEIGRDLVFIARALSIHTFRIAAKMGPIHREYDCLSERQAKWGGTRYYIHDLIAEGTSLLAVATRKEARLVEIALRRLQHPMLELKVRLAKATSQCSDVERQFDAEKTAALHQLEVSLTFSTINEPTVKSAFESLLDAFPHRLVQRELQNFKSRTNDLFQSLDFINNQTESTLTQSDRERRDRTERKFNRFLPFAALLATIIAAAQFIGPTFANEWIPAYLVDMLCLISVFLMVLFAIALGYIGTSFLWQFFREERDEFAVQVHEFWSLIKRSEEVAGNERGKDLEELDRRASDFLVQLMDAVDRAETGDERPLRTTLWLQWLWARVTTLRRQSREREFYVKERLSAWTRNVERYRRLIYLFDLFPDVIPLPRTLCLLHGKSTSFLERSPLSDEHLERSLRQAGLPLDEIITLREWLRWPQNQGQIKKMDAAAYCARLKEARVTADPEKRMPVRWRGLLQ